jgi:hypothetical protein
MNLFELAPDLNDEDWKVVAFAMRCKGWGFQYRDLEEAVTEGRTQLMIMNAKTVLDALRDVAPSYPAALDVIHKLQELVPDE